MQIRTVNQIGGANGKDYTERVLNAIFSQSFATDNTWEGKKTKYKVNKLNLINICEGQKDSMHNSNENLAENKYLC